jgi:iron complex transport system substrate-binding protein
MENALDRANLFAATTRSARWLVVAALLSATAAASAAPRRLVSLNPCLDAILLQVADRRQIAAISHSSRDPASSIIARQAAGLPVTYATAEEVIALSPDLVLASRHTALATRDALKRLGIPMLLLGVPRTVDESREQILAVAAAAGHPARGAKLAARIDRALTAARPADRRSIPALIFQYGGMAPGAGTLPDELLRRAGFANMASRYGIDGWGVVPLERLVADPPRVVFGGTTAGRGGRLLDHPAARRLRPRMTVADFPAPLMQCGGPAIVPALERLRAARVALPS